MTDQAVATVTRDDPIAAIPAIAEMASRYNLSPKAFVYTFRTVAMPQPHSDAEFVSCCLVAREHGLNALTKEIFFMRTKSGQIQPIVSVDGWIRKCNEHPQFDGMEFKENHDDKGALVSMTISIYRKDRSRPTTLTEYFDECSRAGGPVWKSSPHRMMRNRTICQGGRLAFGFAGIMEYDEFLQWQTQDRVDGNAPAKRLAGAPAEIPEVPPDDTPDIIDPIPEVDIDAPPETMSPESERNAIATIAAALDDAAPKFFAEVLDGYEDVISSMSEEGKRHVEEAVVNRLLKGYARDKAKAKFVDDVMPLLDKLSDPARRSVEAVFEGRVKS